MDKKHYCQNILGLILLPLCVSTTLAFTQEIIKKSWTTNTVYFFLGAALYLFIHIIFHKPIIAYVTGHELTHALWGFLFGAKIKRMKISKRGGSVGMSRTNIFVSLAPYVFPIYTFLVIFLYFVISFFWKKPWLGYTAVFLIGVTFCFHIVLTLCTLKIHQSDLQKAGYLFSIVFIYLVNIFVLTIIFTLISHRVSLGEFILASVREGHVLYNRIISSFLAIFNTNRG